MQRDPAEPAGTAEGADAGDAFVGATDSGRLATASGLCVVPSIRLLSVGRARWGKSTDRLHPHVYPSLVTLRTVSGGGLLRFTCEGGTHDLTISEPGVVLFNDATLERVTGVTDQWVTNWFEFASPERVPLPHLMPVSVPYSPEEAATTDSIQAGILSSEFSERAHATAQFIGLLYGWFRGLPLETDEQAARTVETAMKILRDQIYEPTSVESVATRVGVHPVTLRRQFREHLLMSPKQYFDRLRIEESRRMLQRGMLAKQVAAKLGYKSARHYGRVFKDYVGLTVKEYRSRYRDGKGSPTPERPG